MDSIYRGYDVTTEASDEFFWADEIGMAHGPYETEEAAMNAIDVHRRARAAAKALVASRARSYQSAEGK